MPKSLNKHTIVIWSESELDAGWSLEDLGREADQGAAYCSSHKVEVIDSPTDDPDWDGTEFFGLDEEDEELEDDHASGDFECHTCGETIHKGEYYFASTYSTYCASCGRELKERQDA